MTTENTTEKKCCETCHHYGEVEKTKDGRDILVCARHGFVNIPDIWVCDDYLSHEEEMERVLIEGIEINDGFGLKKCPFCKARAFRHNTLTAGYYIECLNGHRLTTPDWRDTDKVWNSRPLGDE